MRNVRVPELRDLGLILAALMVGAVFAFALLWAFLLWVLGMMWLLEKVGLL